MVKSNCPKLRLVKHRYVTGLTFYFSRESPYVVYATTSMHTFLKGKVTILTPDLYLQRSDDSKDRLMHHNGSLISTVERCWKTPTSMVVIQKEPNSTQAQVYDKSGKLLKELDSWPQSVEIPYREFCTWTSSNGKVGILDPNFNTIIEPQYDAIYTLKAIPNKFTDRWVKYAFRNLEHPFLGWI